MRYKADDLTNFTKTILQKSGLDTEDAMIAAESIISADLRGVSSHGITRIRTYAKRLKTGVVKTSVKAKTVGGASSALLVDGQNGMGSVVGIQTMDLCIAQAKKHGSCFAAVRNGNHFGIGSFFTMRAAGEGMIGIAMSNAPASVVPTGGRKPMLGTNPLSVAVPAGRHPAFVLDMASSVVAQGKVILAAKKDEDLIPEGWAVDADGLPTTRAKEALKGYMLPFGGAKGYAIAFLIDILSSSLSGAFSSTEIRSYWNDFENPQGLGFFMGVWDVEKFLPLHQFKTNVDELIDKMKSCPPTESDGEVYIPGELEYKRELLNLEQGIELSAAVIDDLVLLAQEYSVNFPESL